MYQYRYGLEGGFGGCGDWEDSGAVSLEEALQDARTLAIDMYESFEGSHGLANLEELMEEGMSIEAAEEEIREDMESWICYDAREV